MVIQAAKKGSYSGISRGGVLFRRITVLRFETSENLYSRFGYFFQDLTCRRTRKIFEVFSFLSFFSIKKFENRLRITYNSRNKKLNQTPLKHRFYLLLKVVTRMSGSGPASIILDSAFFLIFRAFRDFNQG